MFASNVLSPAELGRPSVLPYADAPAGIFSEDIVFRKLGPSQVSQYRDHLIRLDPEARARRFGASVGSGYVDAYAEKLRDVGVTILGCFVDGVLRGVAELHEISPWWGRQAEAAFSVEAAYRGQGLGGELFRRLVAIAQNRWIRRVHMVCLLDNPNMRHLAESARVHLVYEDDTVTGVLTPSVPTALSVLIEYMDDVDAVARLAWPFVRALPSADADAGGAPNSGSGAGADGADAAAV